MNPTHFRTPPRTQQGGLPLVDEGFSQDAFSPCCSAVSDTTSLAAELMSKDITQSLQSVAYISMALESHADEDCSQTSQAVSLRIGQKLTAEIGNTFLAQFQSDAAASAARSADGAAAPEVEAEAIAGIVQEAAKFAVPSEAAHAAEPSEVTSEGAVTKEIVPIVASPEETSRVRTPSLELGHQLATEMLLLACSSAVSLPSTARSVATSDQVFPKADIDEVNMLTRAIAADAIADDASAHTVDVLTDVSDQPGQLAQSTSPREASAPSARQRPEDLEVAEGKEVRAPRTIRRDSTLTIPSPNARDAEVMHSNEVQLQDDVAVDDLATTDSIPFGIMITDAETRKSIVLLEAPILDPPPARQENECETESEENVEAPTVLPDLKDTVEEAIWSAVLEEVQRDAEASKEASLVASEARLNLPAIMGTVEEAIWSAVLDEIQQDAEAEKEASLVTSEGQSFPEQSAADHQQDSDGDDQDDLDDLVPTNSVPFGIMITDAETRKSIVLLEPPQENECETESEENVEAPTVLPDLKDTVEEAIWSAVLEEVQRDAETYKEASLVTSEGHGGHAFVEPNSLEVPTRFPSRSPTEVTILPVVETAKTMDELLDEINVLQASLTYSDELPADPEMEADKNSTQHVLGVSLSQPFSDLISSGPQAERDMVVVKEYAVAQGLDRTPTSLPEASPQDAFEQTLAEALIDAAVIKECILHGEQAKLESSEVLSAGEAGDNASDAPTLSPEIAQDEENERAEEQLALHMSLKEALQDKASEAGTVTVEEARELEEERVEQTLILTSSLNQPLEKLLGADAQAASAEKAADDDDLSHTLAKALLDSAAHETDLDGVEARSSSQIYTPEEIASRAQPITEAEVDLLLDNSKKRPSRTGSEAPTVSPEMAQEEEERFEQQRLLQNSLRDALNVDIHLDAEATVLDEFGENLAKELLHVAILLDAESNEANRVSSEVLSASEAASEAPTVSPEVAREDEERMDHERMLQSSLKEALREADSGKPQAASTYISNCSMPEALASESVGLKVAQELLDSALEHEQKEQAKRNSSEVLSATQVETLETADGPTRQASEAATVSPEVAREDEERMDQERLLQSSLKEAVDTDSTKEDAQATAMAKFGALAEELLDAAMEEIKRKQEAQSQVQVPERLATPSIVSERSSCEAAVVEAFGLKLAQDLLDEASFLEKQEVEASQVITENEVSRPPSEVTIVPGLAQKTRGELMDEIDILASSLTLANQREQEVDDRPSSSQSDRDPSRISVLTTGSTAAMEELVHLLVVNSLPEKTDVQQSASNVHTEGSELMAPTVQPVEVAVRPASAGLASSVSASEEGSYGLQMAQDAVHTACDAITALKSDSAGKEAEQEAGAESAEDALIAHAAEEVLVAAQSAALAAETASVLHSEVGSFDCEVLPVIPILETPEAPSEIETERTKPSEEDPNMKEFVHRVVDDVLEHPSPEGSLQETASQDRSEVQTDRTDRSLAIAGPESICSAGSEEAALLQAAVGADLSEGIDLAETAPSGVVSARTAASLEERIVAEVAGDLLPEQNQAALLVLVKELQRRPLQNPEVELHLLSAPATFAAHGAEPSAADTVPADETPVEAEDLALETAPGPGPPPRFTALKAESDGGAQPTSVPGKPAVPDFIYANASTKAEALASDVAKEIDTEDLLAIASEALALDVIAQEIHLEAWREMGMLLRRLRTRLLLGGPSQS
ncbi:unnamed protein product [Cladocopium goreaui]|uniref:Uncharacterized protein n=1 Tax=Cladocopium goreaui TaxID=2562237 RepID=A0A9P1DJ42_9DINO|nr:unnamed protein product [Cladocopium goreaui]